MVVQSAPKKISRPALKSRRLEIEQRIAAFGLARGPRRLFSGENTAALEEARSRRLRTALEGLGPIFSSFGLYMSARGDLWPAKDCLELAAIPDRLDPTPPDAVRRLLSREIGCLPEEAFSAFEAEPFESRLLFQSHHAQLNNGTGVIVKITHPEVEGHLLYDIDLLSLLKDSFAGPALSDLAFKSAAADFCHNLHQQMDFVNEARAFTAFAQDAEEYDALRAPQVYEPLCTSKVLTIEKLSGMRLDEVLSSSGDAAGDAGCERLESVGFERDELARLLCEAWLRQALLGRCFPVDPNPQNVLVLPGKQIAFTGGAFASLPAERQANLWTYLIAAANENSDKACSCLLKEMRREGTSFKEDEVRQRFRQAMPFRDGGWNARGDNQSLAELLFVHWRFASGCGYLPLMHLPAFFRGLFSVADSARRLAPQVDPLTEGVRDLRLLAGLAQFRKMISQDHLADQIDRYATMMTGLPQSFDEALTFASEGRARLKLQTDSVEHRGGTSSAVIAALMLVLAAVVLLSHYIAASAGAGAWSSRINAIVFIVFGALLLRTVSRVS